MAGFVVSLADVDGGAGQFRTQGMAALTAGKQFQSAAALSPDAFGNLPQAAQVAEAYAKLHSNISEDMVKLSTALMDGTAKLALSAFFYRLADELAAERAKGIVP